MSRLSYWAVKDNFYIDESSPTGIRWKINTYSGKDSNRVMSSVGQVAGNWGDRYYVVQFNKKKYFCHRVIYLLKTNKELEAHFKIDHIDQNPRNNSAVNLRECTQKINSENRKISSANTSGVTGVSFKSYGTRHYCSAHWKEDRKTKSKSFSIEDLGLMEAFKAAVLHRNKKIEQLNIFGANYTGRHGK